ncbi:hypothetical protein PAXRUDRAFT_153572, partial [Paxillus rubicundulus Ve08.2h10]
PLTTLSSYIGSTVSSIKPSSVLIHTEHDNTKHKADDEDCSSMVSITSHSAVLSMILSGKHHCLLPVPTAINEVGDQLGSLNEMFHVSLSHHDTCQSASTSNAAPTLPSQKDETTEKLVELEAGMLMPSQIVLIMDIFNKHPLQIDAYLVLTKDTPVYNAIQKEWLKKQIEEVKAQQSQQSI